MQIVKRISIVWGEVPLNQEDALLWMERCGRTCYNSLNKIKPGSARPFIGNLFNDRHMSVLEHSNLVLRSPRLEYPVTERMVQESVFISPFIYTHVEDNRVYIYGNYRAFWEFYQKFPSRTSLCDGFFSLPECARFGRYKIVTDHSNLPSACKAVTVEFLTPRSVTHEIVRHRPVAYSQESQRYCRYDDGVTFIVPVQFVQDYLDMTTKGGEETTVSGAFGEWMNAMSQSEDAYLRMRSLGQSPQQARSVLTNSTASRLVATAYLPEWQHIFNLRCSKAADPEMIASMLPVYNEFMARGWV